MNVQELSIKGTSYTKQNKNAVSRKQNCNIGPTLDLERYSCISRNTFFWLNFIFTVDTYMYVRRTS